MMGRRRPFIRLLTVKEKLVVFTLSMLVPVLLFSYLYLLQSQRILEEKAGNLNNESLELSTSWMDEVLRGAVRVSSFVESDTKLRNFLLEHQEKSLFAESILNIREIQQRLEDILATESRATSIWVYFPQHNEVISTQFGVYEVHDYVALDWLKGQSAGGHIRSWIYPDDTVLPRAGSLLDFTMLKGNGSLQISFTRSVPGFGTKELPVIVGVGYLEYTLQDLVIEAAKKTKTSLILRNQNGHSVLETGSYIADYLGEYVTDAIVKPSGKPYAIQGRWLVTTSESKLTGWQVVSIAPLDKYMGELKLLNGLTTALTLTAFVLAIWAAGVLTRGVHQPLLQLLGAMKLFETGDMSARVAYDRRDEFGKMAEGFNRMAETQENLIRTVYQERIAKQEAEMNYLTAQINPHFLYNTLGALYSMAKRVNEPLAQSLLAMSRLFRLSLNEGKDTITVRDTMEHITNYMVLLNIRNPGKYRTDIYVEPGAESFHIPTLIVQPLVENAVKHGLELVPGQGIVRVAVTLLKRDLMIMVTDSGSGMSAEQLERLRETMTGNRHETYAEQARNGPDSDEIRGSGYALRNIYRRLQLKYHTQFLFQIDSAPGKGTVATIRIPRKDNDDETAGRG